MSSDSIQTILQQHGKQLGDQLGLDLISARFEVAYLLQAVLNVNYAWLLTHSDKLLDADQQERYNSFLERRLRGEPVAYILGAREFYGLTFRVTPDTLIPRPETELLVEEVLRRIPKTLQPYGFIDYAREGRIRVLDLGTGSGAIAVSIAHARPNIEVVAVDISSAALEVAESNAKQLNVFNLRLKQSDWFSELHGERFDIVVANPPYVAIGDEHLAQGDLRFEPDIALVSGVDGLVDIGEIVSQSKNHLNENGWLILEHGYDQAEQVREIMRQEKFTGIYSVKDLAGIDRLCVGCLGPVTEN